MVLLILALIWAAVLLPPFVRSRLEGHPTDSVGRFRRHLRILESTSPAASSLAGDPFLAGAQFDLSSTDLPSAWANEARRLRLLRRRQQVAFVILGIMATTFVLGLIPSFRALLALHVIADAAFVSYLVMLAKARHEGRRIHATRSAVPEAEETRLAAVAGESPVQQQVF